MGKVYKVEIRDRNKKILYKNKVVRSPVNIEVSEEGLGLLKAEIRQQGVQDYKITELLPDAPPKQKEENEEFVIAEDKVVIIEELTEKKPKTILDKLIEDGE